MKEYDAWLDKKTDEYNQGCVCYQQEDGITEHCKMCETYCLNYLNLLGYDELQEDLKEQQEYYQDFLGGSYFKNYPEAQKHAEKRIQNLKEALTDV